MLFSSKCKLIGKYFSKVNSHLETLYDVLKIIKNTLLYSYLPLFWTIPEVGESEIEDKNNNNKRIYKCNGQHCNMAYIIEKLEGNSEPK